MLPHVTATRYVAPLREGGSLPAVVEADDCGTYVMRFHGAGQGRKALVAEIIAGELARRLGFRVPDLVLAGLDPVIARHEPDPDIQDLLKASTGLNLGVDFLPGSIGYDPVAFPVGGAFASRVLWFDAYVGNVDRSWRNPNLLVWHRDVWLIDHGATLYFHHAWSGADKLILRPYDAADHVLGPYADDLTGAGAELGPRLTTETLAGVTALVPDEWLEGEPGFASAQAVRDRYVELLLERAAAPAEWLPALPIVRRETRRGGRPLWLEQA